MSLFKEASRRKLRFVVSNGTITVEDLWDLSLNNLDTLAKAIHRRLKEEEEVSFIEPVPKSNSHTQLQLDIVKEIIAVKVAAREDAKAKIEKENRRKVLLEVLARKQEAELEGRDTADILKELESL